jgi:hypothetical protein
MSDIEAPDNAVPVTEAAPHPPPPPPPPAHQGDCSAARYKGDGSQGTIDQQTTGVIGIGGFTCPGVSGTATVGDGVTGTSVSGNGVSGFSTSSCGVYGLTTTNFMLGELVTAAVQGENRGGGPGVKGSSSSGDGVLGWSFANNHAGVSAVNSNGGIGLWAQSTPGGVAGHFDGNVEIKGDLSHGGNINMNGGNINVNSPGDVMMLDCAEDFEVANAREAEPGTVMVIDDTGALEPAERAYDKRVAGVISGAGDYRPAIVLNGQRTKHETAPVALFGKVYCKVDAKYSEIEVGDLLTTSATPGHAMKASDPFRAFGAVVGKALRGLREGCGLIPVLVALQ